MARTFEHKTVEALAKNATVPVINGLTNYNHPCQILTDLFTIKEKLGTIENIKLAFLGDCTNNTCHSWLLVAKAIGMQVACAFPEGYAPGEDVLKKAKGHYSLTNDSKEAVTGADVIYTDTWMSLHIAEEERFARTAALMPYQVTESLMKNAKPSAIFMHCLPAHRGEEMTTGVIDGPQSVVIDEAENRMWTQNAIILKLMEKA